ncbi:MAG: DUF433 domain-containing protein [Chloroflexota bacterium]|nr:DUF433 domain-containing protein [Chloroflexota bacterium]
MTLSIVETPVPLRTDAHGTVRVGGTRVTLDSVVGAFLQGATAEDIVRKYPTLNLADVYAVLSYYLRRRADVDAYLREQEREAAAIRRRIEADSNHNQNDIRARLLARIQGQ